MDRNQHRPWLVTVEVIAACLQAVGHMSIVVFNLLREVFCDSCEVVSLLAENYNSAKSIACKVLVHAGKRASNVANHVLQVFAPVAASD